MVRNDIKNSSLLKTKFLIYAFNGRTRNMLNMIIIVLFFCLYFQLAFITL